LPIPYGRGICRFHEPQGLYGIFMCDIPPINRIIDRAATVMYTVIRRIGRAADGRPGAYDDKGVTT
jgi:hypothetical protein